LDHWAQILIEQHSISCFSFGHSWISLCLPMLVVLHFLPCAVSAIKRQNTSMTPLQCLNRERALLSHLAQPIQGLLPDWHL
jgi:hypothetical protein